MEGTKFCHFRISKFHEYSILQSNKTEDFSGVISIAIFLAFT